MAYDFNGTSQYLSTSSSPVSGYAITLFCHFYFNGDTFSNYFYVGKSTAADRVTLGRGSSLDTPPRRVTALDLTSTAQGSALSTAEASDAAWGNTTGVFSSSSSRTVYLNGGSSATDTTNTSNPEGFNQVGIGARFNGTSWATFLAGRAAEYAIWNVALTAAEISSLGKGFKPTRIRPQSLVFYAPLIRNIQDTRGGRAITNNNSATVAVHPRVI